MGSLYSAILLFYLVLAVRAELSVSGVKKITRTITTTDIKALKSPKPTSKPTVRPAPKGSAAPYTPKGISHHGGPVIDSGTNIYVVWYGNWASSSQDIIRNFLYSLEPDNDDGEDTVRGWWNIHSLYYNTDGNYIDRTLHFQNEATDLYSQGTQKVNDTGVYMSIFLKMFKNELPFDENGIYLFLSSPDVKVHPQTIISRITLGF